jgi:Peptidase A4 family
MGAVTIRRHQARGSWVGAIAAVLAFAGIPAAAQADSQASTNWSGYVAHRSGLRFRRVTGEWTQPSPNCAGGSLPSYSSTWVGLGGYSFSSLAVEQVGTELDCTIAKRSSSSAWYEILPAPAKKIRLRVSSGDEMSASVTVFGGLVSLRLTDRTTKKTFSKSFRTTAIDVTSADWIVEAPTVCDGYGDCQTLPLANFVIVHMTHARAQTAAGRWGSIASPLWQATRITLLPDPFGYTPDEMVGTSTPSPLGPAGEAFDVSYAQTQASSLPSVRTARLAAPSGAVSPGGPRRR